MARNISADAVTAEQLVNETTAVGNCKARGRFLGFKEETVTSATERAVTALKRERPRTRRETRTVIANAVTEDCKSIIGFVLLQILIRVIAGFLVEWWLQRLTSDDYLEQLTSVHV